MGLLFEDDLLDEFGCWPLGYIPAGGADFGEVQAVGRDVGKGDAAAFHAAFVAAAERLEAEAERTLAAGHRQSARELFLRAAVFFGAAYHPLYGAPVDPRLLDSYRRQIAAFDRGLALGAPPVLPMRLPFEGADMLAYLIPAEGRADETRPLLIATNGYDATVTDLYFATAVAASRRGYHVLIFDGPGQGGMLYEHGVPIRPDWETVIGTVVDHALTLTGVDAARIALVGWSLGGYLALRAATGEPRLAAVIADPGLASISGGFVALFQKLGLPPETAAAAARGEKRAVDEIAALLAGLSPDLRWKIEQRGFWVHGVSDIGAYLGSAAAFTLDGRLDRIRCPTLLTMAEDDQLAKGAPAILDALACPKTLLTFTRDEGAGGHCELFNRSLATRRMLDWLDTTLGA